MQCPFSPVSGIVSSSGFDTGSNLCLHTGINLMNVPAEVTGTGINLSIRTEQAWSHHLALTQAMN